ncbi:hypothetical protein Pcinc_026818 [Petrolisthes cinctipes]|uniref:Uncharacterized protein n=1 Tax=Petrolisthes cinctipes TaxID=88211 RepID=A0AAE1F5S8_PETCI|nr:hypothetical protein Pcinc_026818 [Petrolisthes cinctipes]
MEQNAGNGQQTGAGALVTAITELRADIKLLNRTINNENKDNRRQLYPDMLQTSQQPNQQADANQAMTQTRQVKHPGTLYADVAGKVKPNQHAVFIKPKDLTTPSNNKEIISTLKQVPMHGNCQNYPTENDETSISFTVNKRSSSRSTGNKRSNS